jgi:transcription elongation factor Elf1
MKAMLKRLVCWLRGHEITIDVEADDKSAKATATCRRCGKVLGVTTA